MLQSGYWWRKWCEVVKNTKEDYSITTILPVQHTVQYIVSSTCSYLGTATVLLHVPGISRSLPAGSYSICTGMNVCYYGCTYDGMYLSNNFYSSLRRRQFLPTVNIPDGLGNVPFGKNREWDFWEFFLVHKSTYICSMYLTVQFSTNNNNSQNFNFLSIYCSNCFSDIDQNDSNHNIY